MRQLEYAVSETEPAIDRKCLWDDEWKNKWMNEWMWNTSVEEFFSPSRSPGYRQNEEIVSQGKHIYLWLPYFWTAEYGDATASPKVSESSHVKSLIIIF